MSRKPRGKNRNSPRPNKKPIPPQPEKATLPSPHISIRDTDILFCLGLLLCAVPVVIYKITGDVFFTKYMFMIGLVVIGIYIALENFMLPPVDKRIQFINLLNILGFVLSMVWISIIIISGSSSSLVSTYLFISVLVFIGIGFVLQVWPLLHRFFHFHSAILAVLHAAILWVSICYARKIVAEALGLPPQDFELTVAACSLVFYTLICIIMFSVLSMSCILIDYLFFIRYWIKSGQYKELARRRLIRSFGAWAIIFITGLTVEAFPNFTKSLQLCIRKIAYFADFQKVSIYPRIDTNRKLRLLENGVVSYAEEHDGKILISVEEVQPSSLDVSN